jgi:hypothetical protein
MAMPGMVNNMATGMAQPKSAFSLGPINVGGAIGDAVGHAVNTVSNTVNQAGQGIQNIVNGQVGTGVGQVLTAPPGMNNVAGAVNTVGSNIGNNLTHLSDWTGETGDPNSPPPAPGVNPALTNLQTQQQTNATNFRNNIPQMEQSMGEQLKASANQTMGQQLGGLGSYNSSRGMGYGGVNQGQQQRVRSAAQSGVAQGQSNINAGLQNAANTLDAEAVNTGLGIQQTQQSIQNNIYSQAMTQMNANNSMVGGFLGTGLLAGLVLA